MGVGFGDEVLVPAVTFIASASAITEVGAVPRFVDIDPETAAITPSAIEDSLTDKTKAVMVVHYGGYPVDFDKILPIEIGRDESSAEDSWPSKFEGAITLAIRLSENLIKISESERPRHLFKNLVDV